MEKKIDTLRRFMQAGQWREAMAMAARFPVLGKERDAIVTAHEATAHPRMYRQLGIDPDKAMETGIDALRRKYANTEPKTNKRKTGTVAVPAMLPC